MLQQYALGKGVKDWPFGRYLGIVVNPEMSWGASHFSYETIPHCSFSIGFLRVSWSWGACRHCDEEGR